LRAELDHANLFAARLSGANLRGARLLGADLSRVDFAGAEGLSIEQLRAALNLSGCILPDGTQLPEGQSGWLTHDEAQPGRVALEEWIVERQALGQIDENGVIQLDAAQD
ncbi:MAG: pentapeptide repeat-containing protein, partial [Chloroflexi bacterium]|nr:pentapeptide repeat-containing protein [Chloroflexota bacterium]